MRGKLLWGLALACAAVCGSAIPALGIEHGNLDERHPLRFEDPYPVPQGEWSIESGLGFEHLGNHGPIRVVKDHVLLPVDILYGAALNAQISVGTGWSTRAVIDSVPGSRSIEFSDLRISALYNFRQETTNFPALALKYTLELPTGTRTEGVDTEIKALVTKSYSSVSFHLNLTDRFIGERSFGARSSLLIFDLGASLPLQLSRGGRNLLLAGWHSEQGPYRGLDNITGFGLGIRRQQTARTVLDAGVETESTYGATNVRFTGGLSWSY